MNTYDSKTKRLQTQVLKSWHKTQRAEQVRATAKPIDMTDQFLEVLEALEKLINCSSRPIGVDSCGQPMVKIRFAAIIEAREVAERARAKVDSAIA